MTDNKDLEGKDAVIKEINKHGMVFVVDGVEYVCMARPNHYMDSAEVNVMKNKP